MAYWATFFVFNIFEKMEVSFEEENIDFSRLDSTGIIAKFDTDVWPTIKDSTFNKGLNIQFGIPILGLGIFAYNLLYSIYVITNL